MKLAPEDPDLRKVLRDLAKLNIAGGEEKILFLDGDYEVIDVLYAPEIDRGGHIRLRDHLLDQARLRAILHLGLVQDGVRRCYVHVIDPDAHEGREKFTDRDLLTLRQTRSDTVVWVHTPDDAVREWNERWFPDA